MRGPRAASGRQLGGARRGRGGRAVLRSAVPRTEIGRTSVAIDRSPAEAASGSTRDHQTAGDRLPIAIAGCSPDDVASATARCREGRLALDDRSSECGRSRIDASEGFSLTVTSRDRPLERKTDRQRDGSRTRDAIGRWPDARRSHRALPAMGWPRLTSSSRVSSIFLRCASPSAVNLRLDPQKAHAEQSEARCTGWGIATADIAGACDGCHRTRCLGAVQFANSISLRRRGAHDAMRIHGVR